MRFDIAPATLIIAATVLAAMIGLLIAALVLGTAIQRRRRRRLQRVESELQRLLRDLIIDGGARRSIATMLAGLPEDGQIDQVAAMVRAVTGRARGQVHEVADIAGMPERGRRLLRSRRWHRRLRGARLLTLLGAGHDVVPGRIADPHPEVRAQAADWMAEHGDAEAMALMLETLDSDQRLRSFVLVDCLSRAGSRASGPLRDFLASADVADPVPALTVAASLADQRFSDVAHRWSSSSSSDARAAAARLLTATGDAAAVNRLTELLDDADAAVRAACAEGLGRLEHRPAAPALAAALEDPAYAVRRHAGLALRQLGDAGPLYLRRALRADDAFAADMAHHVLSLPDQATR